MADDAGGMRFGSVKLGSYLGSCSRWCCSSSHHGPGRTPARRVSDLAAFSCRGSAVRTEVEMRCFRWPVSVGRREGMVGGGGDLVRYLAGDLGLLGGLGGSARCFNDVSDSSEDKVRAET